MSKEQILDKLKEVNFNDNDEQNEKKKEENQIEVDSIDSSVHRHRTSLLFNCGKSRSTSKKRKIKKEG